MADKLTRVCGSRDAEGYLARREELARERRERLIEVHRTGTYRLLIPKSCKKNFEKFFG